LSIFGWTLAVLDLLLPKYDGFEYGVSYVLSGTTVSERDFYLEKFILMFKAKEIGCIRIRLNL
jgi:hypothetical protein